MEEIIDQILHFLWTFIALAPVLIWRRIWAAGLTAFLFILPREFVDQSWNGWPIGDGKLLDILFFVLGGLAAGYIFLRVKKEKAARESS